MTVPEIDVVILTWNDGELLDAAVRSALASEGVEPNVIVLDNGSDPPADLRAHPGVDLRREPVNLGVAAGRNRGVAAGHAPLVCLLDSDARLEPDCLRRLAAALEADPATGLVAPVFVDQRPVDSGGRAPTLRTKIERALNRRSDYESAGEPGQAEQEVDFVIGACQMFRRVAFDSVGGLDASYFYGPEDVDFCLRLRERRWRVLQVAAARCHHPPRRRNRRPFTVNGARHARAVVRHLWRHRRFDRRVAGG